MGAHPAAAPPAIVIPVGEIGHVEVGVEGELGETSPGVLEVLLGAFPLLGLLPEEVGQLAGYRRRMVNQDQLGGLEELQEVLEMAVAHGACHVQKDEELQAQSVHLGVEALEDEGRGQLMGHLVHEGAEEER